MLEPVSALTLQLGVAAIYGLARPGSAVSGEARLVQAKAEAIVERVERSGALFGNKSRVVSELGSLAHSHSDIGWDGGKASPVSRVAIAIAVAFVRALPESGEMPEVGVDPDGAVSLDWIFSRHRMLSVSIADDTDRLAYAWVDGTDRGNAVERFDGNAIPRRLTQTIVAMFGKSDRAAIRVA